MPLTITTRIVEGNFAFDLTEDGSGYSLGTYTGASAAVTVPGTMNGKAVTEVGEEAFMDKKYLASIDLPDSIVMIRARAFKSCSNLTKMK